MLLCLILHISPYFHKSWLSKQREWVRIMSAVVGLDKWKKFDGNGERGLDATG